MKEMKIISRGDAKKLGLRHYFTGKECPNGHIAKRFVSSYTCSECAIEHHRRYRKDPEFRSKELAYKARYRKENREKIAEYSRRKWRVCKKTREKSREYSRRNAEKRNEYSRWYYKENKERILKRSARWRKRNQGYFIHKNRERRARLLNSKGGHTKKDVKNLLKSQRFKCINCRSCLRSGYHVDHMYPLSKGGSNDVTNIQILCPTCNLRKSARDPIEWAQDNGRLL